MYTSVLNEFYDHLFVFIRFPIGWAKVLKHPMNCFQILISHSSSFSQLKNCLTNNHPIHFIPIYFRSLVIYNKTNSLVALVVGKVFIFLLIRMKTCGLINEQDYITNKCAHMQS